MINTTHISQFFLHKAQYFARDEQGNAILLKINYKDNTYLAKNLGKKRNQKLAAEAKSIAEGLLKKKHNVNLAERGKLPD